MTVKDLKKALNKIIKENPELKPWECSNLLPKENGLTIL